MGRQTTWDDLPPQPWPEATEPPVEALADWLLSLPREQFVWLLDKKRQDWSRDSRCFLLNHDREIEDLRMTVEMDRG